MKSKEVGCFAVSMVIAMACSPEENKKTGVDQGIAVIEEGKILSLAHCQSCHAYPEPELLDKNTWEKVVLPKMGHFMGIYHDTLRTQLIEGGMAAERIEAEGVFPKEQAMPDQDWAKIVAFYTANALSSQVDTVSSTPILPEFYGFETIVPDFRNDPPMTTLLSIDDHNQRIFVGDAKADISSMTILDYQFEYINTIYTPAPPSGLTLKGDSLWMTMMGRVLPTDKPSGMIINAFRAPESDKYNQFIRLADMLQRPVHTVFADLTNDGLEDIIVCEFGNFTGSLSWFENTGRGFTKHILLDKAGALKVELRDVNKDGHLDIFALMGQGDESIWILKNKGKGQFKKEQLLRFFPTYGVVDFELVDLNGDGFQDILLCNGDNGDYNPILKSYHGIRIFENDGDFQFKQTHFFSLHGAYKASAADFDQDGDLDIFGISFYPDFTVFPNNNMIFIENKGKGAFLSNQIKTDVPGRWITFDVGDLDGDEDLDILLGSYTGFPTYSPIAEELDQKLRNGNSLLLLKNHLTD